MPKSQVNIEELSSDYVQESKSEVKPKRPTRTQAAKAENELRDRLSACFDRIADALEQRNDNELADIIREDSSVMAAGLVSVTRPFRAFRTPLLILIAVVEPALAFGRIVRVLAGRFAQRRYERQMEAENAVPA